METPQRQSTLGFLQQQKTFSLLMLARLVSVTGDNIHLIATMWLVQKLTSSALAMGIVFTANTIPKIAFALIGGVSVDRYDRKRILIGCDALRALGVGALILLAQAEAIRVWHVALFAAVNGAAGAFYGPALNALLPTIVRKEALPRATALGSMNLQIASMAGGALGGLIIAVSGIWAGYSVDALSYVFSAVVILVAAIPKSEPAGPHPSVAGPRGVWADLRAGLGYVVSERALMSVVALWVVMVCVALPVAQLLPSFTERGLGLVDSKWIGFLWSSMTVGMFLSAALLNAKRRVSNPVMGILVCVFLYGAGAFLLGSVRFFAVALGSMLLLGFSLNYAGMLSSVLFQTIVPKGMLGRFFANTSLITLALQPLVMWLAGMAADMASAAMTLAGLGVGLVAFSAAWTVSRYRSVLETIRRQEQAALAPSS